MGKLIPLLLILIGTGAGVGAGFFLRPAPEPLDEESEMVAAPVLPEGDTLTVFEFTNQFMVPLIAEDRITSVIVIRLALEVSEGQQAAVTANTARLRDALLQVMFDHANLGGFTGVFTDHSSLTHLRRSLLEAAQKTVGPQVVFGVLITDLLRSGG
ncbi:MAG: flagellar basal body-associated protein FliL [Rhodobacteraceae bacterium]|nr:MAG: flagellar basal body-associated protein FliL [Paracoccaceae bacterium]